MKSSLSKIIFSLCVLTITLFNSFFLLKKCYHIISFGNKAFYVNPGREFSDFQKALQDIEHVGFLTNKDMSSERNDGQFLAAQYILAPTILNLGCLERLIILDYTNPELAMKKITEINAVPVYTNPYGKILAQRTLR